MQIDFDMLNLFIKNGHRGGIENIMQVYDLDRTKTHSTNQHGRPVDQDITDYTSLQYLPSDISRNLVPIQTPVGINCLYNAISISITGM